MFRTSAPVTAAGFHDRREQLAELTAAFDSLPHGAPAWVAIIGRRKVGKTSLLLEAARRTSTEVDVAVLDVLEMAPLTTDVFRTLALRALDALLSPQSGASFERAARNRGQYQRLLDSTPAIQSLPAQLRTTLRELSEGPPAVDDVRELLQVPEDLAKALERHLVLAIDEVQELSSLARGRRQFDPFPVMRAVWQRHEHVAYAISGSALSMMEQLVTSRRSPFFQHFRILRLGAFERADAVSLLVRQSPPDRKIPQALAERCVDVLGGNPFYLQMAGEALVAGEPPYDEPALKQVVQSLVFSRSGRLGLYFENEYQHLVGASTTLAAVLETLADGPRRQADIARAIQASAPSTARYLDRLGDAVARETDGSYAIADHVFADWLKWRAPGGTAVPMTLLGDEGEKAVANYLAQLGFELVYQSRASRGAFDLLALRGPSQLGVQVKRADPPLRFSKAEWGRMDADASRWGWSWTVAHVDPAGRVSMLDPARARRGREIRIDDHAAIGNLLLWLDHQNRP